MADKISKITARQALEVWGLRVCGGSLKSPTKKATGGNASVDDEMSLARYVEATPGFERARPALVHVYAEGQPVESFRLRHPGETTTRALIRLGWMGYLIHPPSCIACEVLREFEAALEAKIADCPWWPPSSLCSPDDEADIPAGMVWSETLRKYIEEAKEEK